ncbi:MAG: hypothetical protein EOP87_05315, partial [Verrucomicrobiaceae bacterium]
MKPRPFLERHSSHLAAQIAAYVMCWGSLASAEPVVIARDGAGAMPVVVPAAAPPEVRAAAERLAEMLGRISGGKFGVEEGDGT